MNDNHNSMDRKRAIQAHYEPRIKPDRPSYDVHDWSDPISQQTRFDILIQEVPLAGKSLLDVGCGLGDLLDYLRVCSLEVDYTGVDLLPQMIKTARRLHPAGRFLTADIFRRNPFGNAKFDVVFCSGVFNLKLGNNDEFLRRAIGRLTRLAGQAIVINLLHHRSNSRHDHCHYYDPRQVNDIVRRLGWSCRIRDDYLPHDFTAVCCPP